MHAYDLTYGTTMHPASPPGPKEYMRTRMLPEITRRLEKRTGIRSQFYGNWVDEKDFSKGWATYSHLARYGSNYRGLTGMMDMLSEIYSYLPFRDRVRVNRELLIEVLDYCAENLGEMERIVSEARRKVAEAVPGEEVPIAAELSPEGEPIEIQHRTFEVTLREENGRLIAEGYSQSGITPVSTTYFGKFRPTRTVRRPTAYVAPPDLADRLRLHGIEFTVMDAVVLNQGAIQRGLGRSAYFRSYESEEQHYPGGQTDKFEIPKEDTVGHMGPDAYKYLDEEGIVEVESFIKDKEPGNNFTNHD